MQYINVVIDSKSIYTDTFYTYAAPDEVSVGDKVTVPFAGRRLPVDAYCVETGVKPSIETNRIKQIKGTDYDRSLSSEMIDTAVWMRTRYGVKYIDAIKMFTVGGKKEPKPYRTEDYGIDPEYTLSASQQAASEKINAAVRSGQNKSFLIKGVTNSGKTEVYMRAVAEALRMGRTAIVLLPEIALASQIEKRFQERFGEYAVATLHSKLTTSRKLGEWLRIRRGEARIVVGARTSVFAPLENIGVIIIDEEHESTYKSDHNPKYETVDVAYKRALTNNAVMVLGSATPSVVSYYRAGCGIYELLEMNERIGSSVMPDLETVDMREEARAGNLGVISRRLAEETDAAIKRKEQVILFLNRRGFSTQIMCPDCGFIMKCPDCGITLTYHKSDNAAVCHYCGRKYPLPDECPDCGSRFIKYVGAGTEKVEQTVRELWPDAGIARFDLDTAQSQSDIEEVISDFRAGKTNILIGTQILAKGLDFQNVGLVGIINADVSLNIPDYRATERTYQLITQVAGRAGRNGGRSIVLIQTYDPESDVIKCAAEGDYETFYESELLHRNVMNYPPYSDIISVGFVSERSETAAKYAEIFRDRLLNLRNVPEGASILRPREEERKTDGKTKVVFLIKAPAGSRPGYVRAYMDFRDALVENKADCYIEMDVNPYGIV